MNILAIDTATDACSCALETGGTIVARHAVEPRRHSELLLPMVHSVLEEAGVELGEIDAIAFGRGPGSFTGLRIACAVAQGLGLGAGCPLVPVSTLQVVATGMRRSRGTRRVLVAFDARMGEVYWGGFEWNGATMVAAFEESVAPPDAVHVPGDGPWAAAGSGWSAYPEILRDRLAGRLDGVPEKRSTRLGSRRRSTCSLSQGRHSMRAWPSRRRKRRPCTCAATSPAPHPGVLSEGGVRRGIAG